MGHGELGGGRCFLASGQCPSLVPHPAPATNPTAQLSQGHQGQGSSSSSVSLPVPRPFDLVSLLGSLSASFSEVVLGDVGRGPSACGCWRGRVVLTALCILVAGTGPQRWSVLPAVFQMERSPDCVRAMLKIPSQRSHRAGARTRGNWSPGSSSLSCCCSAQMEQFPTQTLG